MRLTGRQCEPDRQAIGIYHRMNLAGQPAAGSSHRLSSVPDNASTMLMHADNRRVDHLHGSVVGARERVHNPGPDASPPPANEAIVAGAVRTEAVRQIAPRC